MLFEKLPRFDEEGLFELSSPFVLRLDDLPFLSSRLFVGRLNTICFLIALSQREAAKIAFFGPKTGLFSIFFAGSKTAFKPL